MLVASFRNISLHVYWCDVGLPALPSPAVAAMPPVGCHIWERRVRLWHGARELSTACRVLGPYASETINLPRRGSRGPLGKRRQMLCRGGPDKETYSRVRPPQKAYRSHWPPDTRLAITRLQGRRFLLPLHLPDIYSAESKGNKMRLAARMTRLVPACELVR